MSVHLAVIVAISMSWVLQPKAEHNKNDFQIFVFVVVLQMSQFSVPAFSQDSGQLIVEDSEPDPLYIHPSKPEDILKPLTALNRDYPVSMPKSIYQWLHLHSLLWNIPSKESSFMYLGKMRKNLQLNMYFFNFVHYFMLFSDQPGSRWRKWRYCLVFALKQQGKIMQTSWEY